MPIANPMFVPSSLANAGPGAFGGIPAGFGGVAGQPIAQPFNGGFGGLVPPPQAASYNPGGGYMPAPIGGQFNQLAQQMAGPMFMPAGTSILAGRSNPIAPQQPSGVTVPPTVGTPTPITSRLPQPPPSGPYGFNPGIAPGTPRPPVRPTIQPPINIGSLGSLGGLSALGAYGGGAMMPGSMQGARGGLIPLRQMRL